MLQINDYECEKCGNKNEIMANYDVIPVCDICGSNCKKIFNKMRFELKYNPKTDMCSWGNEGYNSSQYWKDVKKAREDGKKVKGANEN